MFITVNHTSPSPSDSMKKGMAFSPVGSDWGCLDSKSGVFMVVMA